jgi:hypothetical protein
MDSNITPELLQRYAQGRCTPEEIAAIEQWLEQESDPFESDGNNTIPENDELRAELWNAVKPLGKRWCYLEGSSGYFAYLYPRGDYLSQPAN